MNKPSVIGIDIGGTKTLCLLADRRLGIIDSIKFRTSEAKDRDGFIKQLLAAIDRLKQEASNAGLTAVGVGVGCAGSVEEGTGVILSAPNIQWLEKAPLKEILEERLDVTVTVGNDVQLGLYGEHQLGAAQGCQHVLGVFFGTGVGGALILNGKLFGGAYGLGGQVGCLTVHATADPKEVQIDGMLDRIVSKASIFGSALGLASKNWAPHLRKQVGADLEQIKWQTLAKSIKSGDKLLEDLLRSRLHTAGAILANVVNFIGPEMVVLGGGLTEDLPRLVLQEIDRGMRPRLVPEISKVIRIVTAKLENQAVALGAAKRAFEAVHESVADPIPPPPPIKERKARRTKSRSAE